MQIDKCFGFDTAVEEAQRALLAAKVEASSAFNGVGIVKLMGRQSGFIAMNASMASGARPRQSACCSLPAVLACLLLDRWSVSVLQHVEHGLGTCCAAPPYPAACQRCPAIACMCKRSGSNAPYAVSPVMA